MKNLHSSHYRASFEKIKTLTKPNPWLYWTDLLGTALCCYGLMYICMRTSWSDPMKWLSFLTCGFLVNRGLYFMHEVLHQGRLIKGFETAQNLLFGFLFKLPSYIHAPHHHHHRSTTYGTQADPEYDDAFIGKSAGLYCGTVFVSLLFPVLLTFRFGILPLFYPVMKHEWRLKIYQRASTFALNPNYLRPLPTPEETKSWLWQDGMSCVYHLIGLSVLSLENYLVLNLFSSMFFFCNFFRTLVAHKYSASGDKTIEAQVKDSISIPNSLTDFFWAPVGLKYHGLHHYFPTIPYHNLKKAHETLMQEGDALYRLCLEENFHTALLKAMNGGHVQVPEEVENEEKLAA